MTKAQAIAEFRQYIAPAVRKEFGRGDVSAIREAWCNFTDALMKNRRITGYQDRTWTNPF